MPSCMVGGCDYQAEDAFEDFKVCLLHASPQVLTILDDFKYPHAYWMDQRPIVLPAGPLTADHLVQSEDSIELSDCSLIAAVPEEPSKLIHPKFDLTR